MSLTLIGYMGSGKTAKSKRLGNRLNLPVFDLDHVIENYANSSISEIFEDLGEDVFRTLESKMLKRMLSREPMVLSLGGGTPCYNHNMEYILQNSFSVYLQLNAKVAFSRLKDAKSKRPLIAHMEGEKLLNFIEDQITYRESFYNRANMIIQANAISANTLDEIKMAYTRWLEK